MQLESRRVFATLIATALFPLLISSCGSDGNNPVPGNPAPGNQPGAVPTVTIDIPQGAETMGANAFGQNPMIVQAGTKVVWMNHDSMAHTATADDGAFDTGPIAPGQSASWVATQPGTHAYHCMIHPTMTGTLQVEGSSGGTGDECAGMPDGTPCGGETCERSCTGAPECGSRVYHFCEQGQCHGRGVMCTNPSPAPSATVLTR